MDNINTITTETFDNAVLELGRRIDKDCTEELLPLRNIFESRLNNNETEACNGIIKCINSINTNEEYSQLLSSYQSYDKISIKLRENTGFPFNTYYCLFWEFINYISLEQTAMYLWYTYDILQTLQIPEKAGDIYTSAIMNVSHNLVLEKWYNVILQRFINTINFLTCSMDMLPGYNIELTGSDPHMGGRQVLFISDGTGRYVYKPRSMAADNIITGQNGFFNYMNSNILIYGVYHLPCININEYNKNTGNEYGIEDFAIKKTDFTEEAAFYYYKKMGVLAYLAKLAGITDLHQDNIMPTEQGPLITDAECIFLPDIISSPNLDKTGLNAALCQRTNALGDDSLAYYTIAGKDSTEYNNVCNYYPAFIEGFLFASGCCSDNKETVIEQLYSFIKNQEPLSRILPFSTSSLAGYICSYETAPEAVVKDTTSEAIRELTETLNITNIDETLLKNNLDTSFKNGDIPLFQVHITPGRESEILLNGIQFAITNVYSDENSIKTMLENSINHMAAITEEELISTLLPK